MPALWFVVAAVAVVAAWVAYRNLLRVPLARQAVLEEVRRKLRGGQIEHLHGRGPQARGRHGQLEITVDLFEDPKRRSQSPMWRVLAIGPVRIDHPVEMVVGDWRGWIDPWMQLAESRAIPSSNGPALKLCAEHQPAPDHPVIVAMANHAEALVPGALHARPDLMRAEVQFTARAGDNRGLFAYLAAMAEVSELSSSRTRREQPPRLPHTVRPRAGRPVS